MSCAVNAEQVDAHAHFESSCRITELADPCVSATHSCWEEKARRQNRRERQSSEARMSDHKHEALHLQQQHQPGRQVRA